jgi:hypothetical protein
VQQRVMALVFLVLSTVGTLPLFAQARPPLRDLPRLKTYTNHRLGSYETSGTNDDGQRRRPLTPGETRTIAEIEGPGIITHIWVTIATPETYHLKRLVLRIYWDGEESPSVEAPIGDFFGLGLGEYFLYESELLSVGSQKALNSFFPMPFRRSAEIRVTHEGELPVTAFYYNIDYEKHDSLPEEIGYFHAQYRQQTPTDGWTTEWKRNSEPQVNDKPNTDGVGNYVILEAKGRGHYVGVTHSILQNQGDWWGEGDEMIFVDGERMPGIIGTGSEDYYLGAWCYGGCGINPFGGTQPIFDFQRYGNPMNGGDDRGAKWMVYRLHTESPIAFTQDIRVTVEHGHANHRSDNFYTVAYWYQTEPHRPFEALPAVSERIPRGFETGGPTSGRH